MDKSKYSTIVHNNMSVPIPYGNRLIKLDSEYIDRVIYPPNTVNLRRDVQTDLFNALENPIGSPPLYKILKSGGRVVIVIDDYTRKYPPRQFIPALVRFIKKVGDQSPSDISLLIGCGTHHPPNSKEELRKLTVGLYPDIRTEISSTETTVNYIFTGKTQYNTPVYLHPSYINADIRIILTDITPHYFAGFGGGRKSVVPGVAGLPTVNANHKMATEPGVGPAILDGNSVHEDLTEAALTAPPHFTVNVLKIKENLLFFAGDMCASFVKATEYARRYFVYGVGRKADILLISPGGYPYDINYYQSLKAIHHTHRCLKKGGIIVLFAECREGIGNRTFAEALHKYNSHEEVARASRKRFNQGINSAYYHLYYTRKYRIMIVTDSNEIGNLSGIAKIIRSDEAVPILHRLLEETEGYSVAIPHAGEIVIK